MDYIKDVMILKLNLYKVSAFPKTDDGGNKAGVVVEADLLNEYDMRSIAAKLGFSETAFVLKSEVADFKVQFFTPTSEVDLCGHATIATFNLLRDLGKITTGLYTQETKAGILRLDVQKDIVYMEQNPPMYFEYIEPSEIEECFEETDFTDTKLQIRVMSTGVKEIFVPVVSVDVLHNLTPDFDKIRSISLKYGVIGIHCFALDNKVDAYSRNFAPLVGIDEESATGTSNGALSCYLNNYVHQDKTEFVLRQGYSMNMPSEILAKITKKDDTVTSVYVGGNAIIL